MSDQRYDASETVALATSAAAVVGRSPRVGYVPGRANLVRDVVAIALLVISLFLPWNLDFGLGIPGTDGTLFAVAVVVTLLAILAALTPHVGPFRLTAPDQNVRRTSRIRLLLGLAYFVVAIGFVVVSAAGDLAQRRNRPCAAGDRARPAAGPRGRAAGVATADHEYHARGQRLSALVCLCAIPGRAIDRARDAGGRLQRVLAAALPVPRQRGLRQPGLRRHRHHSCSTARRR